MDRVDGTPRIPHIDPHTGTPITFDGTHNLKKFPYNLRDS
jgi:hypothetical protein